MINYNIKSLLNLYYQFLINFLINFNFIEIKHSQGFLMILPHKIRLIERLKHFIKIIY